MGGQPLVTGGKIDDVSVTHRVETHPDISTLLSARVKEGNEALGDARPLKRQRRRENNWHVYAQRLKIHNRTSRSPVGGHL